MSKLIPIAERLRDEVDRLSFSEPVTHVYNPLVYAWEPHRAYLERFGGGRPEAVFVGMNPGPFGMAQTGVPFGEVSLVRDWMGIDGAIGKPDPEHEKRPIDGFACSRSEVSGRRLWGWAKERFGSAEAFFSRFFILNYCPLVFLEATGRNRTPDKLRKAEAEPLLEICDRALAESIEALSPDLVIAVGVWAEKRASKALPEGTRIGRILHPSPASPLANKGWEPVAEQQLRELGIALPE